MDVALVRDPPQAQRRSMEIYADDLEAALGELARPDLHVYPFALQSALWERAGPRTCRAHAFLQERLRYPLLVSRLHADLAHVIDHGESQVALGLPRAIPLVVTCHDLMRLHLGRFTPMGRATRLAQRLSFLSRLTGLRKAAMVIADSRCTRRDLIELLHVPAERISVIYPGIRPLFFQPDSALPSLPPLAAARAAGASLLLHVSTGSSYKNVEGVLQVIALLRSQYHSQLQLVQVGRSLTPSQRQLATHLGLDGGIIELGRVSDPALAAAYRAVDVFLFPSHYEGFGWPPLEAMASGTPAVISTAPALVETAGPAALAAPALDVPALAAHVQRLLSDTALRTEMVRRGRERAAQFSWRRTAEQTAAVYGEVYERTRCTVRHKFWY